MIIESFMDNLYFGTGTQDHLSTFRKWDFSPTILFYLMGQLRAKPCKASVEKSPISKSHFQNPYKTK